MLHFVFIEHFFIYFPVYFLCKNANKYYFTLRALWAKKILLVSYKRHRNDQYKTIQTSKLTSWFVYEIINQNTNMTFHQQTTTVELQVPDLGQVHTQCVGANYLHHISRLYKYN